MRIQSLPEMSSGSKDLRREYSSGMLLRLGLACPSSILAMVMIGVLSAVHWAIGAIWLVSFLIVRISHAYLELMFDRQCWEALNVTRKLRNREFPVKGTGMTRLGSLCPGPWRFRLLKWEWSTPLDLVGTGGAASLQGSKPAGELLERVLDDLLSRGEPGLLCGSVTERNIIAGAREQLGVLGFSFPGEGVEHIGLLAVAPRGGDKSVHLFCTAETVCVPRGGRSAIALAAVLCMPQFWIESLLGAVFSPINVFVRHRPIAGYSGCTGRWLQAIKTMFVGAYENRHEVYVNEFKQIVASSFERDSQSTPAPDPSPEAPWRPRLALTIVAVWVVGAIGAFGFGLASSESVHSTINPNFAVENTNRRIESLRQKLAAESEDVRRCYAGLQKAIQDVQEIFRVGTGVTWDVYKAGRSPRELDRLLVSKTKEGRASATTLDRLDGVLADSRKLSEQLRLVSTQVQAQLTDEHELSLRMAELDRMLKECTRLTGELEELAQPVRIIGVLMKAEHK